MSAKKGRREQEYEVVQEMELRRGPWTVEEDTLLIHYIAYHGEGRWNLLARCSGLKRTGKSCRLRWLNYLKPDVKRGNLTLEEQMLILDLHSKWGNRWSMIAQHLPGRTDNEIKNYWRTRVQKHARQLKIDANSTLFRDAVRCLWMPSLMQKVPSSPQQQEVKTQPVLRIEEDPRPQIPNHDLMVEFENYNSAISLGMNTPQFALGAESGDLLANDMHAVGSISAGGSTVSDCPMMEDNHYIDHSSSIEESLWSIWMNDSISSNPESYLSGESRS